MKKALRYTQDGRFQVIEEPIHITKALANDYPHGLIRKLNYDVEWTIGRFDRIQTSAMAYVIEEPWSAIVVLSDSTLSRLIFVDDMGLLMRLRIELAALCANESSISFEHDTNMSIEKAFRAWHGHDVTDFCRVCDPQQVAALARAKAQIEEARFKAQQVKKEAAPKAVKPVKREPN